MQKLTRGAKTINNITYIYADKDYVEYDQPGIWSEWPDPYGNGDPIDHPFVRRMVAPVTQHIPLLGFDEEDLPEPIFGPGAWIGTPTAQNPAEQNYSGYSKVLDIDDGLLYTENASEPGVVHVLPLSTLGVVEVRTSI